ncbi:MAG: ERF family protein [Opitutae bacterium]
MDIYKRLRNLQTELKAPKGQYNSFGKYKYRSAEDILEAVKPLTAKHGITMYITDDIEVMGERTYVKATVYVHDDEGNSIKVTSYAREEENKKGMDGSQVTGASSSYARKYALNAMLLIDDTKDSDATNDGGSSDKQSAKGDGEKDYFKLAIDHIKNATDKESAYETVMKHYGDKYSEKQISAIKKWVPGKK